MPSLLDALGAFNRRERHILVGWVLDRLTFPLGHEFRQELSQILPVGRVPADAFVAMDYNLNWLCAALMWAHGGFHEDEPYQYLVEHGIELADNSDCDLLVAFAQGERTHVVLLEAKGFMPFSVPVLKHKADRLRAIFGAAGNRFLQAVPHWVFVGPKPPPYVEVPEWMVDPATGKLRYLALPQPASHKFAVVRCDEHGHKKDAGYWKIRSNPWPGLPEQEADSLT